MQLLSPRNMDLIQILLLLGLVTIIWALKPRKKKKHATKNKRMERNYKI